MADIVIRGMEMPKNEPLAITITQEGKVFRAFIPGSYGEAVPLPEGHGRLIDADALLLDAGEVCEVWGDGFATFGFSREQIENAPTIVPAEGGENE